MLYKNLPVPDLPVPVIQVVMLDYGYRDSLKSSQLRPLEEGFLSQSSFCLRCHLIDIQPAGDITKWSRTACEYLVELLARATCFIKQKVCILPLTRLLLSTLC